MTKEQTNSWIEEFDKNFTLQENGCSDCITESLFYKGKPCYDLNELKVFISKVISQEKEKWETENKITENTSDGYHTFKELYEFRKLYNATFFNTILDYCHKSLRHSDGELCFGGGWFIVTCYLDGEKTQQISNHYEVKDWDLFKCEEREMADKWDGHTSTDVVQRLKDYLLQNK